MDRAPQFEIWEIGAPKRALVAMTGRQVTPIALLSTLESANTELTFVVEV